MEKEYLAEDIIKIAFDMPDGFIFQAGQFIKVMYDVGDKSTHRDYSILNPPKEKGIIKSCIKLTEKGYGSEKLRSMQVGDEFDIQGPLGRLLFDKSTTNKEHVFICTGTGVTPFYSILHEYIKKLPEVNFTLIYGSKSRSELVFHEDFQKFEENSNFKYIPTLSRESNGDWNGKKGRVQEHLWSKPKDYEGKTFYICGLKDMIKEVRDTLISHGVKWENIHIERYD